MVNVDQAEGLRRILSGAKPRFVTFLSALGHAEKNATLVNLSAGLTRLGDELPNDVLLLDMQSHEFNDTGVGSWLNAEMSTNLVDIVDQHYGIRQATYVTPQGFKLARFYPNRDTASGFEPTELLLMKLNKLVEELGRSVDLVLVDGELSDAHGLMSDILEEGEIVILVTNHPDSIKAAYSLVKRAHSQFGRRSYHVLVTDVNENEAQRVYAAMAQVAENFLSVPLTLMGYVPQDDCLRRASLSGITIFDAFPKAGASMAFSRLAQQMLYANEPECLYE